MDRQEQELAMAMGQSGIVQWVVKNGRTGAIATLPNPVGDIKKVGVYAIGSVDDHWREVMLLHLAWDCMESCGFDPRLALC
jgi:hypothetical protein